MVNESFKFTNHISHENINKIYDKNFKNIIYQFANFQIQWLYNAYSQYKDLDKYLILIKLIHKTLNTYNRHFYKINFEKFYKNSHIEIEKVSIIDLVKELNISKETARRKLNELSKQGIILRNLKKMKVNQVAPNSYMEKNIFNLAKILSIFSKNLGKEIPSSGLSKEEIKKIIDLNYTQYWSLFFNFQIPYILRNKKIFKSIENFYIFGWCALNQIINSKNVSKSNEDSIFLNIEKLHENVPFVQIRSKGLNSTTISELSGIPRATVIRKMDYLVKKDFLMKNNKTNLFSLNNKRTSKAFKVQGKMFKKNQNEFKIFVREILNLINNKNIN